MMHKLHAIVLWSRRSREADKIIGFFSETMGRLTARATSAARPVAKFAALTEPFVECEIALHLKSGQDWGKLVGGRLLRSFPRLRTDLTRTTAAAWICELVNRLTPEEQSSPEKFALLSEALDALEEAPHSSVIRLGFAVRFLDFAGFGIDNRDPWLTLERTQPERAAALRQSPLKALGQLQWDNPVVFDVQQLVGSVVNDHLSHPLQVNRFRQMTGIEI